MNERFKQIGKFFAQCKVTRAKASGAMALTINDVNDNEVVFEVNDEAEITIGTKASPDGVFVFANGKTIKIEGGEVVEIVTEIEVPEDPQPQEKKADEQEEIDKDAKIAELEVENEQLKQDVKTLRARIAELEGDNETNAKRLAHLEALAKSIKMDDRKELKEEQPQEKKAFSFKKK